MSNFNPEVTVINIDGKLIINFAIQRKIFDLWYKKKEIFMIIISEFFAHIGWRGVIEIIVISTIFYYISLWLKADNKSRLLIYFYAYCLFTCTSYLLDLPILFQLSFYGAPICAMLFILIHQERLQKNYIALRTYTPARQPSVDWYDELLRCCLINRNAHIPLHIIIEHNDSLEGLIDTQFKLNSSFQLNLLQTLIKSELFNQEQLIWMRSDGTLVSINAQLRQHPGMILDQYVQRFARWQQDAFILSKTTDAITISSDHQTVGFTMIMQESVVTEITAENCLKILKKHIMHSSHKGIQAYGQTKQTEKQKSSH